MNRGYIGRLVFLVTNSFFEYTFKLYANYNMAIMILAIHNNVEGVFLVWR